MGLKQEEAAQGAREEKGTRRSLFLFTYLSLVSPQDELEFFQALGERLRAEGVGAEVRQRKQAPSEGVLLADAQTREEVVLCELARSAAGVDASALKGQLLLRATGHSTQASSSDLTGMIGAGNL